MTDLEKIKIFKKNKEIKFKSNVTYDNNVKLLLNGVETFSAIKEALSNAKHRINLEYFIMSDDEIGRSIKEILSERSRAGVKVRVILDAIGSWHLGRKFNFQTVIGSYFAIFRLIICEINGFNHGRSSYIRTRKCS